MIFQNILYNTFPKIIHSPSPFDYSKKWLLIQNHVLKLNHNYKWEENLTVFTFNNTKNKGLLQSNLDNFNLPYNTLGENIQDWSNRLKISLINNYLSTVKTDYVIGLDCFDILLISNPKNIIELFKKNKCNLLFNATTVNYPDIKEYEFIESNICKNAPFKYLNAGAFIGETKFCQHFYSQVLNYKNNFTEKFSFSEQVIVKPIYHKLHPQVKIDSNCELFQVFKPEILDILRININIL